MKIIQYTIMLLIALSISISPTFAEMDNEKLSFASYLEESLGHLWAIEKNLDENNAELALVHATHPIAELYDLMKPELEENDPDLNAKIKTILLELGKKTATDVTRDDAQKAIDDAKEVIEIARSTVVGDDLSNDLIFKINLMKNLLETSVAEYEEAISDGQITMMAEFQDGSAFVWKSQQIYATIKSEIPEREAEEIDEFYEELWAAYDERAEPSTVETLAGGIIHELEEVSGMEVEVTELSDYVTNVQNLLIEAKEEYEEGVTDEALSLATKAYLDNYEFLEAAVGTHDPELNEEIEHMMREELRDMIKSGAPPSEVSAHVDEILEKMDTVAVIVPEFGPIAVTILAIAIVATVVIVSKNQRLNFTKL